MNRSVRLSLSFLVTSTIMWFLAAQRLREASHLTASAAENEARMGLVGIAIASLLLLGGLGILIAGLIRSRKEKAALNG